MIYKMIHQSTKKDGLINFDQGGSKHYFWVSGIVDGDMRELGWYTHGTNRGISNKYGCNLTSYLHSRSYYKENQTTYE